MVSVASNVAPKQVVEVYEKFRGRELEDAAKLDQTLAPLYSALFVETNPVPCKVALELLGLCSAEVRLPLSEASAQTKERMGAILRGLGLIR